MAEEEDRLSKKGAELFRELKRIYPVAEVDDYFKMGAWKDDLMKTDLQLVDAHKREAGAPDPPPLEEVPMPDIPRVLGFAKPFSASGISLPTPTGVTSVVTAGGAVAELRLIALFVAKWKLDPTRTKTLLGKLVPARRRYVIANFKTEADGVEATDALEAYIGECEQENKWPAAVATPATVTPATSTATRPLVVPPTTATGVKRPFSAVVSPLVMDPSKKPRPAVIPWRPATAPAAIPATRFPTFQPRAAITPVRPVMSMVARPVMARPVVARPVISVRPATVAGTPWGTTAGIRPAMARPAIRPAFSPAIRPVVVRPAATIVRRF